MMNRRDFLGITASAGAALALTPEFLRALQQSSGKLIQRPIPSTGEMLPVIGLSFSNHPTCADQSALKQVLKTFADNGGKVVDSVHASIPAAEQFHVSAATELGIQNKVFWSLRGTPGGPPGSVHTAAGAKAYIDEVLARLNAPRIDLMMISPTVNPVYLANLKEEKKAGRVRYIGVQVIADERLAPLEAVMRNELIDFIGVKYDIGGRKAEETVLPLAQERKIAVMAMFPLGNNAGASCGSGRTLFARVGNTPLPAWAAEFDAKTWAQFFLKYVISHPAITVARVGTSKPQHMLDNMAGGIGRLPNEATRKRMAELIDSLPPLPPLPGRGGS